MTRLLSRCTPGAHLLPSTTDDEPHTFFNSLFLIIASLKSYCRCCQHAVWIPNNFLLSHKLSFHNDAAGEGSADLVSECQGDAGVSIMDVDSMARPPCSSAARSRPPRTLLCRPTASTTEWTATTCLSVGPACRRCRSSKRMSRPTPTPVSTTNCHMVTARTCF